VAEFCVRIHGCKRKETQIKKDVRCIYAIVKEREMSGCEGTVGDEARTKYEGWREIKEEW
jgi:hypothetical protein